MESSLVEMKMQLKSYEYGIKIASPFQRLQKYFLLDVLTAQNLDGHSYRKSGHSFSPNGQ